MKHILKSQFQVSSVNPKVLNTMHKHFKAALIQSFSLWGQLTSTSSKDYKDTTKSVFSFELLSFNNKM